MNKTFFHFSVPATDDPEAAFRRHRASNRLDAGRDDGDGEPGAMLSIDVRRRPLFATFELALGYCWSETIDWTASDAHAIAVRFVEVAGFEWDIRRRLDEAPRWWLIAWWS